MKKNLSIFISVVAFILTMVFAVNISIVCAQEQGSTKIIIETDKDEYNVGDTVKVYLKGKDVVDMFGLQFTLNYNPNLLEMQGNDMEFKGNYKVFGGKTVDKQNGIIEYPLINSDSTEKLIDEEQIGEVTFKAKNKGPVILTLENIKAVNTDIKQIQYNTQYQTVFNIKDSTTSSENDTDIEDEDDQTGKPGEDDQTGKPGEDDQTGKPDDGATSSEPSEGKGTQSGSDSDVRAEDGSDKSEDEFDEPSGQDQTDNTQTDEQVDKEQSNQQTDGSIDSNDQSSDNDGINGQPQTDTKKGENTKIILITILVAFIIVALVYIYKNKDTLKSALNKVIKR